MWTVWQWQPPSSPGVLSFLHPFSPQNSPPTQILFFIYLFNVFLSKCKLPEGSNFLVLFTSVSLAPEPLKYLMSEQTGQTAECETAYELGCLNSRVSEMMHKCITNEHQCIPHGRNSCSEWLCQQPCEFSSKGNSLLQKPWPCDQMISDGSLACTNKANTICQVCPKCLYT